MLSYTGQRNKFAKLVNNTGDSSTLTLADELTNQERRTILTKRMWWFFEKQFTATTEASTAFIKLSGAIDRIISDPYVTVSSTNYTPRESPSRAHWDRLNQSTITSDTPEWWIFYAGQLGLFPRPSTAGNTITINAKQRVIDLSVADYTTGTITTTATSGTTTTVTGSSVVWHTGMIGRWIRITNGNAANTLSGDHIWYEIASVPTSTTLTLSRPYGGTALAAASAAYIIGEMSILPEAYDDLPLSRALELYFTSIDPNEKKALLYKSRGDGLMEQMKADHSNKTGGRVLDSGRYHEAPVNPNLVIGF